MAAFVDRFERFLVCFLRIVKSKAGKQVDRANCGCLLTCLVAQLVYLPFIHRGFYFYFLQILLGCVKPSRIGHSFFYFIEFSSQRRGWAKFDRYSLARNSSLGLLWSLEIRGITATPCGFLLTKSSIHTAPSVLPISVSDLVRWLLELRTRTLSDFYGCSLAWQIRRCFDSECYYRRDPGRSNGLWLGACFVFSAVLWMAWTRSSACFCRCPRQCRWFGCKDWLLLSLFGLMAAGSVLQSKWRRLYLSCILLHFEGSWIESGQMLPSLQSARSQLQWGLRTGLWLVTWLPASQTGSAPFGFLFVGRKSSMVWTGSFPAWPSFARFGFC